MIRRMRLALLTKGLLLSRNLGPEKQPMSREYLSLPLFSDNSVATPRPHRLAHRKACVRK